MNASSATGLAQSLFLRRKGYMTIGLLSGSFGASDELPFEPVFNSLSGDDCRTTIDQILSSFRRIHAVISCPPPFLLAASDELHSARVGCFFAAHLSRTLEMETLLLEHMRAAGGGTLINIVSAPARKTSACLGLYQAAQAAICAWSKATSRELANLLRFCLCSREWQGSSSKCEAGLAHPTTQEARS